MCFFLVDKWQCSICFQIFNILFMVNSTCAYCYSGLESKGIMHQWFHMMFEKSQKLMLLSYWIARTNCMLHLEYQNKTAVIRMVPMRRDQDKDHVRSQPSLHICRDFCVDFFPRPSLAPDSFDQRLKSIHRLDKPVAGFLVRIFKEFLILPQSLGKWSNLTTLPKSKIAPENWPSQKRNLPRAVSVREDDIFTMLVSGRGIFLKRVETANKVWC